LLAGWLILGGAALAVSQPAEATHCRGTSHIMYGVEDHCGYFDNDYNGPGTGRDVYDGGFNNPFGTGVNVDNPTELISVVRNGINSGNDWYRNSSRFIVLSMLGFNGGVARGQVTTTHATRCPRVACIDEWENRIRAMSSQGTNAVGTWVGPNGRIDFHRNYLLDCGTINTIGQNDGAVNDDVAPYRMTSTNSNCSDTYIQDHIFFFNTNLDVVYMIRRDCANPVGDLPGLPAAFYEVNLSGTTPTATVVAGATTSVRAAIRNTGPSWSEPGQLQISNPGNISGVSQTNLTQYQTSRGFTTYWYWNTAAMSPTMAQASATLNFTVNPTTPVGTTLTFLVSYRPADETGLVKTDVVTIRVVSMRYPSFIGRNGDTHAGGGIGDNCAPASGFVQGNPSSTSHTQYVVSASAVPGISAFRSNGLTGPDALRLGQNGGYATICRPDIYQAAQDYRTGGGTGYVTRPPGPYNLSSFAALPGGIETVFITGDAQLSGTVTRKLTIIVSGTVTINGPISITPVTFGDPHEVPSLGIASFGPININSGVIRVDAYLFSNNVINTCTEAVTVSPLPAVTCSNTLSVNGFLMARNILFQRKGPFNGSAQNGQATAPGEIVTLIPQLYLNPPRFFDSSVDDRLLEGQGERQPLF
jgi:hypothetical protein